MSPRVGGTPLVVVGTAAVFGVVVLWLVIASFVPRDVPVFEPSVLDRGAMPRGRLIDTVTIDARDPDRWRFFAFDRGVLTPPDTAGWDLAVRRFRVITNGDVARLDAPFDSVRAEPPSRRAAEYQPTQFTRDTINPALARWYRYGFWSHLLTPRPGSYAIRSRDRTYTLLEFVSYYCPGPTPGCVTFRYR